LVMQKTNKRQKKAVLQDVREGQEGTKGDSINARDISQRVSMDLVSDYVHKGAWKFVKDNLNARIDAINSIATLDVAQSREDLVREVEARAHAIALVRQWIDDVEGMVDNHRSALENTEEESWYNVR